MEDDATMLMGLNHGRMRGWPVSWIISGKQICRFERGSDVSSVYVCVCVHVSAWCVLSQMDNTLIRSSTL
jgi:hypothetical protein